MKKLVPLILLLTSCVGFDYPEYNIDPRVITYVDNFYKEARLRGINPNSTNLILIVAPANQGEFRYKDVEVSGLYKQKGPQKYVYIDEALLPFPLYIEGVIFHELGHALLDRKHISSRPSYMNSEFLYFQYRPFTTAPLGATPSFLEIPSREELLDELFD